MINVGVFGASGYAGQELIKILNHHSAMHVRVAVSDRLAGDTVIEANHELSYSTQASVDYADLDLVFLCTPHGASAVLAQQAIDADVQVVDLSADLRLKTTEQYQQWYHADHPAPNLLPAPYGLPELFRDDITNQKYVANPGCYPTSVALSVAPLAKKSLIKANSTIIVDAKSGVSGAGRTPKEKTHFVEVFGNFSPYSVGRVHRHVGEMEQTWGLLDGNAGQIVFTPHLLPVDRGILSSVYIPLAEAVDAETIRNYYEALYAGEPLVDVLPDGQLATLKHTTHTNKAVMSLTFPTPDMVLVICAIDNLRKGAASQAVQNANLMLNLPETCGLME